MSTPAFVNNYKNPNIAGMCFEKALEAFDKIDAFLFAFSDDVERTSPNVLENVQLDLIQNSYFDRIANCSRTFYQLRDSYEEIVENPNTSRFDMDLLFTQLLSVNETFMDLCKEYIDATFSKFGVELINKNKQFEIIQIKSTHLIDTLKGLLNQMPRILSSI